MAGVVDLGIAPPDAPEVEGDALGHDDGAAFEEIPLEGGEVAVPHVDESTVRGLLRSGSGMVNLVAGDPDIPDHWRFTNRELDELAPPLTRYLNRNAHLRAIAIRGDEAAMALVMAGYVGRNVTDGRRARRAREEHPDGLDRQDQRASTPGARGDAGGRWGPGVRRADGDAGADPDGGGMAG